MSLYLNEIYKLDQAINEFRSQNPDVELTPDIVHQIVSNVEYDSKQKFERICKYIKHLESNLSAYDEEIKRLLVNKKQDLDKIEKLKDYLIPFALQKDINQVGTFKVSVRKSTSINITNEDEVAEKYKTIKESVKIDKMRLKADYKEAIVNNDSLPNGCELIENHNLQIK